MKLSAVRERHPFGYITLEWLEEKEAEGYELTAEEAAFLKELDEQFMAMLRKRGLV